MALHAVQVVDSVDANRAHSLLALAYQAAVSVLTKLGETDLAWIASERGLAAAQTSENPVVLGSLFSLIPRRRARGATVPGGAASSNSVGFPQCGQSVVIPAESAGNSIWPRQCAHSPFKYFVLDIFWHQTCKLCETGRLGRPSDVIV